MAAGLMRVPLLLVAMLGLAGCPEAPDPTAETQAEPMPELTETRWQLTSLQGDAPVGTPWIRFRAPDRVDGSAGCNSFSGNWLQQGGKLEIQRLAMTKRHCPDADLMEQERALLDSLQSTHSLSLEDAGLALVDSHGARLQFSAEAAAKSTDCEIDPPSEQIYCTQQYDPVCGCNDKTYGNACTAGAAGVPSWRPGRCEDPEPDLQ